MGLTAHSPKETVVAIPPDVERAVETTVRAFATDEVDRHVRRQLRWIHVLASVLGVVNIATLLTLALLLPDIAASRLLQRMTNLHSQVNVIAQSAAQATNSIKSAEQLTEEMTAAAEDAERAAKEATEAASQATSAVSELRDVDAEAVAGHVRQLREILGGDEGVREALSVARMIERASPSQYLTAINNRDWRANGEKNYAYWTSPGGKSLVPLDSAPHFRVEDSALVIMTASGTARHRAGSSDLHLGFMDALSGDQLSPIEYYRDTRHEAAGNDWDEFTVTDLAILGQGEHSIGFGPVEEGDGRWEVHALRLNVIVIPFGAGESGAVPTLQSVTGQ